MCSGPSRVRRGSRATLGRGGKPLASRIEELSQLLKGTRPLRLCRRLRRLRPLFFPLLLLCVRGGGLRSRLCSGDDLKAGEGESVRRNLHLDLDTASLHTVCREGELDISDGRLGGEEHLCARVEALVPRDVDQEERRAVRWLLGGESALEDARDGDDLLLRVRESLRNFRAELVCLCDEVCRFCA